ncbi:hypothetical protein BVY03_00335 [bacterium K02(2017)]|nr:hypothetical protein BVY03_00335 [bacterium K02(2017)]
MANTLSHVGIHFIFSTKDREPLIVDAYRRQLHLYIIGIIKKLNGHVIVINSVEDHVHLYSELPKNISISKFMQNIKGASSRWININILCYKQFAWQDGYAAFSVSKNNNSQLIKYINNQKQHHKNISYMDEIKLITNQ